MASRLISLMPSGSADRRRRPRATAPAGLQITPRDRKLLEFVAEHRLVRADHVQTFLGTSASATYARLRALGESGLLRQEVVFHRQPACHQITRRGLAAIDSPLPVPRLDLRAYAHDLGVAWLWLAARDGSFGPLREIIGERRLRSREGPAGRAEPPLAVRMGGVGPGGGERLHYPDLLLVTAGGQRVAVELELTSKGRARRERILAAYAADPRVNAVLYLVENRRVGNPIIAAARRLGIGSLVHVQRVALPEAVPARPGPARTAERAAPAR